MCRQVEIFRRLADLLAARVEILCLDDDVIALESPQLRFYAGERAVCTKDVINVHRPVARRRKIGKIRSDKLTSLEPVIGDAVGVVANFEVEMGARVTGEVRIACEGNGLAA